MVSGEAGPYEWLTYREVAKKVQNLASGLQSLNIATKANVGLYSVNRLEWTLGEYACYHLKYAFWCLILVLLRFLCMTLLVKKVSSTFAIKQR